MRPPATSSTHSVPRYCTVSQLSDSCTALQTFRWRRPRVAGDVPGERDGHSAAIIGEQVHGLLLLDANCRPIFVPSKLHSVIL